MRTPSSVWTLRALCPCAIDVPCWERRLRNGPYQWQRVGGGADGDCTCTRMRRRFKFIVSTTTEGGWFVVFDTPAASSSTTLPTVSTQSPPPSKPAQTILNAATCTLPVGDVYLLTYLLTEHRTRLVCLGETPSPRVRCRLAMFTYLLSYSTPPARACSVSRMGSCKVCVF